MDLWIIRFLLLVAILISGYVVRPFQLETPYALGLSAVLGLLIIFVELRVRKLSLKTLVGAALGSILGIIGATLVSLIIDHMRLDEATGNFSQLLILILMAYFLV